MNGDLIVSQTTNSNIQPYQELALCSRDRDLSVDQRFDLLSASVLLGGRDVFTMNQNTLNEIESLKERIAKYEARDQKRINSILDRAIADYKGRGHGAVAGASISGSVGMASILLGPFALAIIPAMVVSGDAALKAAQQEYSFEKKLREAKKNGDFKDVDPEDLPKLIIEMKKEHNEAMKKKWSEDAKRMDEQHSACYSDSGDNYEISFNN